MMIRKNTKAFKAVQAVIEACKTRPDRQKLIRLFITKAGHSVKDRISIEGIQEDAGLFYDINYDAIVNNLSSSDRQLYQSDDEPGIYFFRNSFNKAWDETPFEFAEAIEKEFGSLQDAPAVRKKDKVSKFVLPKQKTAEKKTKDEKAAAKKEKAPAKKDFFIPKPQPKGPDYKLKQEITFTGLNKLVFNDPAFSRQDVFDYYNKVSDVILVYLKGRRLTLRLSSGDTIDSFHALSKSNAIPEWVNKAQRVRGRKESEFVFCNDKEHLLWLAEIGCIEFDCALSENTSLDFPDYIIIDVSSPDAGLDKAIDVALSLQQITTGLGLPSFIKSAGLSTLHIYIPLDKKSKLPIAYAVAEYVCKLVCLKSPGNAALAGAEENVGEKVIVGYALNQPEQTAIAPYSLVTGDSPIVAAPINWERIEDFRTKLPDNEFVLKNLKLKGDVMAKMISKKVNAGEVLKKLEERYSFLF